MLDGSEAPVRRVAAFALRAALLYALAWATWPVLASVYLSCYAGIAGAVFGTPLGARADFTPDPNGPFDLVVALSNPGTGDSTVLRRSARFTGFAVAALVASLTLATPLPWRRRLTALGWGLLGAQLYSASILWLSLVDALTDRNALAIASLPLVAKTLLRVTVHHTSIAPVFTFVAPFLIWALATFRRGDWEVIRHR